MRVYRNDKLRQFGFEFSAPRKDDAGYDIHAVAEYEIAPMQRVLVETGLHVEIPSGRVGLVKDRSSVAAAGIHTLAGVIDSAYRGELKIVLINLGDTAYRIRLGQKVAQLLIVPIVTETVQYVDSLDDLTKTARGQAGFGSTDQSGQNA